eukprot:9417110-Pyramimonas_sp.AAC.1
MERWQSFLNPDASHDTVVDEDHGDTVIPIDRAERAYTPMPHAKHVCALRIRDGALSWAVAERYVPGNIKKSTLGSAAIKYPNKRSGLRKALDHGFLRDDTCDARVPCILYRAHRSLAQPAEGWRSSICKSLSGCGRCPGRRWTSDSGDLAPRKYPICLGG